MLFFTSFLPLRNKFTFFLLCSTMYNYTPFSWSCIKYIALHNIIQYYNMKQQNTFWNSTLTCHIIYFLRKEFKQIFLGYRNVKYKLVTVHINSRLSMPKKRNCILTAPFFWHLIMFRCRIPLSVLPYTVSYNTQSHISKIHFLISQFRINGFCDTLPGHQTLNLPLCGQIFWLPDKFLHFCIATCIDPVILRNCFSVGYIITKIRTKAYT